MAMAMQTKPTDLKDAATEWKSYSLVVSLVKSYHLLQEDYTHNERFETTTPTTT